MADLDKYHNGQVPKNGNSSDSFFSSYKKEKETSNDEIDLKQTFHTIWNYKWLIAGVTLLCGLIAGIIAYASTPIYSSNGSILIEDSKGGGLGGGEGLGQFISNSYGLGAGSTLANEMQVLQSRKLSNAIADTLIGVRYMPNGKQFPTLYTSYPEDSKILDQEKIAAKIRRDLNFNQVDREANVVKVSYESPSAFETAFVVNSTMELYKNISTRENRSSANSAVGFLSREKKRIERNLKEAESELRKFMNKSKLIEVDAQTQEIIKQIADLEARKQEARAKLVGINSAIDRYEKELNDIKPGLADQYSEAVSAKMSRFQYQLAELELEKERMLANYPEMRNSANTPPELKKINRKIDSYKQKIKSLTQNLLDESEQYLGFLGGEGGGIANSVAELNQKLIQLQVEKQQYDSEIEVIGEQLAERQAFFNQLPDNIIDLAKLKRDVKINEELYVSVSQQYAETALWEQTQFGLGRIIDSAYVPGTPVKPDPFIYILIGLVLGFISSIGYVFTKEAFDDTINGIEWMKGLNIPLLATIPQMDDSINEKHDGAKTKEVQGKDIDTGMVTILDTISPVSESYRRLQNNLLYSNPDVKLNSIILTSSGKGEGKTTTISNLAVVLAEAGYKIALIDMDLRRPNVHNMFGLSNTPGIVDVLFDDLDLHETMNHTLVPGLSILCSGRRPPNPSAITQSQAFISMINNLEKDYDYVLIDTPPIGIISDASTMIRNVDGVGVVARFGDTTKIQLGETIDQLRLQNANLLGTVLVAFDHTESRDYNYGSSYYKEVYEDYNAYQTKNT